MPVIRKRDVRIMKIIKVGRYDCLVDNEDYEDLSQYTWLASSSPKRTTYAVRVSERGSSKRIVMHRQIMGAKKGECVDHRDKDGLNNQRGNLRFATNAQSQQNKDRHKNNKSGYKGVFWKKDRGYWKATIYKEGKKYDLGRFEDSEEAARAYNAAAIELFGEFARINEI